MLVRGCAVWMSDLSSPNCFYAPSLCSRRGILCVCVSLVRAVFPPFIPRSVRLVGKIAAATTQGSEKGSIVTTATSTTTDNNTIALWRSKKCDAWQVNEYQHHQQQESRTTKGELFKKKTITREEKAGCRKLNWGCSTTSNQSAFENKNCPKSRIGYHSFNQQIVMIFYFIPPARVDYEEESITNRSSSKSALPELEAIKKWF